MASNAPLDDLRPSRALDPAFDRIASTYQGMMSSNPDTPLLFVRAEISHLQDYYNVLTVRSLSSTLNVPWVLTNT
jgi:hypothetical protein